MNCKKSMYVFVAVAFIVTLVVGVMNAASIQIPPTAALTATQKFFAIFTFFVQGTLPVLGFFALIKFIMCYGHSHGGCMKNQEEGGSCSTDNSKCCK